MPGKASSRVDEYSYPHAIVMHQYRHPSRAVLYDIESLIMSIPKSLKSVNPAVPASPYIGGKRVLAKRLCAKIEAIDHTLYAEPCVGMGGVFFRRKYAPKNEIINDISKDVVTLFRILQRHYPQFMDVIKFQITSRSEFQRLAMTEPSTLTDLERAARFLYLQKTGFGGKVVGRNFAMSKSDRGARFNLNKLAVTLEDIHERLAGVTIECLPFERFIETYDRRGALFYIDPPYYGNETDYGDGVFDRNSFVLMRDILKRLQGRFILSINDDPEIRRIFKGFEMEEVSLNYSLAQTGPTKAKELIISNR